jgi:hypothetical protein
MSKPAGTLALVVVLAATLGASTVGIAQSSQLAVQSATVDPATPAVGDDVTVTATVRNFESSSSAAALTEVTLRSGTEILATVDDPGTLGAGGSMEVPLTTTFDSPGRKRLVVQVYGQDEDGSVFNVRYPVSVRVTEPGDDVQLSIAAPDDPATESRVNVTVANGADANVSSLDLRLASPNASVENPRRVSAALGGGSERTAAYDVAFDGPGTHPLTATLSYRDADGERETVTETLPVTVAPANVDAELDAEVVRANGTARVETTLTNFGNVPLEDVQVRATADGDTAARRLVADVAEESSRTVSIGESSLPAGRVRLAATYEAGGERGEATTTVDFAPTIDGNVTLTGVEVTRRGGLVRLSGSAANVGETDVTGAVVRVVDAPGVSPAPPARDYFVGNVPAGEFTSFELTTRLGNGTDTVPVRVRYIADGEQYTRVVEVSTAGGGPVGPVGPPEDGPDGPPGGGGFLGFGRINLVGILLRVAAVLAVGAGALYWLGRRGDDGNG